MHGTLQGTEPEELARWLLETEGGARTTLAEQTMVAVHTYERLRAHLAVFLGLQGFDALWARALHVGRRAFPWDEGDVASAEPPSRHRLDIIVQARDVGEAQVVLVAVFSQFLALLFTFIGADLGFRLLQQRWPTLPAPTANKRGEEAQQ